MKDMLGGMEMNGNNKVGYSYYVVYEIWREHSVVGKGCCDVGLRNKISRIEDAREIADLIKRDNGKDEGEVVIVNWILMGEFEYEG